MTREVVVLGAARTAIGGFGGALKNMSPCALAAAVTRAAFERANVAPDSIEHVVFGNVIATEARDDAAVACSGDVYSGIYPVKHPMRGMRMSMQTTSAREAITVRKASSPSPASATTSIRASLASVMRKARRKPW